MAAQAKWMTCYFALSQKSDAPPDAQKGMLYVFNYFFIFFKDITTSSVPFNGHLSQNIEI